MAYRSKKSSGTDKSVSDKGPLTPRPPKLLVGEELEYRVARLHIFMGYLVRRACPIYTIANLDQATDLDVFALRYGPLLRREIVISECKSGEVGPLDRIFWLSGVRNYIGAREAFLVRKATKWNIKDFAKSAGVQVIDLNKIEELESNYKISANEWPGTSDRAFYELHVADWNKALSASSTFWDLYQTLISEVRYDEPFAAINYLLFQLRRLTKQFEKLPPSIFHRFLIAESISQLSVFLMRVAESAFDLSSKDRDAYIVKGLTYGSLDPKFAERILNNAYTITRQAVLHVTNKPIDIDRSFFQMPVPPGTDYVRILINEILRSYPLSLTLPQVTDLLLTEVVVKQNRTGRWLKRVFPAGDLSPRLELTRIYLKNLVDADACPRALLDDLQINGADNGAKQEADSAGQPVRRGPSATPDANVVGGISSDSGIKNKEDKIPSAVPLNKENLKSNEADSTTDNSEVDSFALKPPPDK